MPSLNFQKQFAPGILAMLDKDYARRTGITPKTTTIRARRKRPIKKNDTCYLFEAQRTIHCRKLGTAYCKKTEEVFIDEDREGVTVKIDGFKLTLAEAQQMAADDGFDSLKSFVRWFSLTHGLPFVGDRIHFTTTYDRKYYLNKKTKDAGFHFKLDKTEKTILITQAETESAMSNKYIKELTSKHSYGVQYINPLFQ